MNTLNYKKLNKLCMITILISIILGYLNPYEKSMTIIYNFWYPASMFIYLVNVKIAIKISKKDIAVGKTETFSSKYYRFIKSKTIKILVIGWICYNKLLFTIIQFQLYSTKSPSEITTLHDSFFINNATLLFLFATLAEFVVVITFIIRIWIEDGQRDEIILCN